MCARPYSHGVELRSAFSWATNRGSVVSVTCTAPVCLQAGTPADGSGMGLLLISFVRFFFLSFSLFFSFVLFLFVLFCFFFTGVCLLIENGVNGGNKGVLAWESHVGMHVSSERWIHA